MKKKKNTKRGKGGGKPSSFTAKHLIGLAALVAAIYLFTRPKKEMAAAPEVPQVAQAPTNSIAVVTMPNAPANEAKQEADFYASQAAWARESSVGLQRLAGEASGDKLFLNFVFRAKKQWCRGGDLDTMKYAVDSVTNPDILISVESLEGRSRDTLYTSVFKLMEGLTHRFSVKRSESEKSYGLFICLDLAKVKSCRKKIVLAQNKMSEQILIDRGTPNYVPKDYLFYFQHLVVDKGAFQTYDSDDFTPKFQNLAQTVLEEKYGIGADKFKTAWNISKVTRSVPAKIEGKSLVLELPINDSRCTSPEP